MDRVSFDASFTTGATAMPVRAHAEQTVFRVLIALRRRWIALVLATTIALILGGAFLALAPKRYTAEALLQFDFGSQDITLIEREQARIMAAEPGAVILSEARIVRSRPVARQVVERLRLADDPAAANASPALLSRLMVLTEVAGRRLRGLFGWPGGDADAASTTPDPREERVDGTVDRLLKDLTVSNESRSYLLSIGYSAGDPALAARIANTFAEEYLRRRRQAGIDSAKAASEWIEARVRATTAALRRAEADIVAFRTENGVLEPGRSDAGGETENVDQARLRTIAQQLNAAMLSRMNEERRLARVREAVASGGLPSTTDLPGLPLLGTLVEREATLRREVTEATSRFGPQHPDVRQAQAGLAATRARLQAEAMRAITVAGSDLAAARRLEEDLGRQLETQQNAMVTGKRRETELQNRLAGAQAIRARLAALLQASESAAAAAQRTSSVASIVAPADAPRTPVAPKPMVVLVLSLLGGLSAGVGAALLLERRDRGLRTGDDVRSLDLRCLGMVPRLRRAAAPRERLAAEEAIYAIAAGIDLFGPSRECRVVLVTSSLPGEGQSELSRELARTLAEAGRRVMLIASPSSANMLPVQPLDPVMHGDAGTPMSNPPAPVRSPVVMERGRSFGQRPDLSDTGGFGRALEDARKHYDTIILEGEPVMLVADSLVLGRIADHVVHVVRWGSTQRRVVTAALRRMQDNSITPDGLVLTRVNLRRHARLRVVDECLFSARGVRLREGRGRAAAASTMGGRSG